MIEQFHLYNYSSQLVVVLTNTIFNDVESILVAPLKKNSRTLIRNLQIPCVLEGEEYYVDLLDIATVSQKSLKTSKFSQITQKRQDIKYGLDLLIDGF
ncbi:CcdB family protein [Glaciecola sp. 2405UD65-10]|uniref:CcdB family protein n=1 Tax=Glaciecola sp. 2405UD65-10 TaxID=3397244 RepID=UPI003B5A5871